MRINIIAVGRSAKSDETALVDRYFSRLSWQYKMIEVEEKRPLPPMQLMEKEAGLLLAAVPKNSVMVAMDSGGNMLSSEKLATKFEQWQQTGHSNISFLIGGADGLHKNVLERADYTLSLGTMTWPHLLVRAMLAEQIYRASTILSGHPYHRS